MDPNASNEARQPNAPAGNHTAPNGEGGRQRAHGKTARKVCMLWGCIHESDVHSHPQKAPRPTIVPMQEDAETHQRVAEVLAAAKIGHLNLDVFATPLSYSCINPRWPDEGRTKRLLESMVQAGIRKYEHPIVILTERRNISNASAAKNECTSSIPMLTREPDRPVLECISGMHRVAALMRARNALQLEILNLEKSPATKPETLARKQSQLNDYSCWPALLYSRCEFRPRYTAQSLHGAQGYL